MEQEEKKRMRKVVIILRFREENCKENGRVFYYLFSVDFWFLMESEKKGRMKDKERKQERKIKRCQEEIGEKGGEEN